MCCQGHVCLLTYVELPISSRDLMEPKPFGPCHQQSWLSSVLSELLGSRFKGPNPESDSEGLGAPLVLLEQGVCGPVIEKPCHGSVVLSFLHVEITWRAFQGTEA